ncbi:MAG: sel1 repeat family protein [Kordiimonadaceae bacterium]|nr:sel1 repeat family protein [Kordiimonadaceae bacterium]
MIIFSQTLNLCRTGLILVIPLLILSGCASEFQDCSQYAGTARYTECLASKGEQEAQYQLGVAAYKAMDMDTAIKWLKKAAQPNAPIEYFRNPMVGNEINRPLMFRNIDDAYPGYRDAQILLAKLYFEGSVVEKDLKKVELYNELSKIRRRNDS